MCKTKQKQGRQMWNNEEKSQTSNWVQNTWFDGDGLSISCSEHETNQIIATWKLCKLATANFSLSHRRRCNGLHSNALGEKVATWMQLNFNFNSSFQQSDRVGCCNLQCENISAKRLILCKQSLKINWKLSSVGSRHFGNNFNFGQNFSTTSFFPRCR